MDTGEPPRQRDDATGGFTPFGPSVKGLLAIRSFRNLFAAGAISSFGDWLALLATTALAAELAPGGMGQSLAVSGVFILRIGPAVILGPFAGVVADRLDRRRTMIIGDLLRFALFVSIALVGTLWWMYVAIVLIECVSLFWNPAKDATVPNLVPPHRLEMANQLSLVGSYGTAPIAALVFSGLSLLSGSVRPAIPALDPEGIFLAIYVNGATFLASAWIVSRLTFPPRGGTEILAGESVLRTLADGLLIVKERPLVRGLVAGMIGAFAGGGLVIGLAARLVKDMGAGAPGYGISCRRLHRHGHRPGPGPARARRALPAPAVRRGTDQRRRGLARPGACSHAAACPAACDDPRCLGRRGWVVGYTLLGLTVEDEMRGRTFALVQSVDGVVLVIVLAVAPVLAAAFDAMLSLPRTLSLGSFDLTYTGAMVAYLLAGLAMSAAGVWAWRAMNDRPGLSLIAEYREVRGQRRAR